MLSREEVWADEKYEREQANKKAQHDGSKAFRDELRKFIKKEKAKTTRKANIMGPNEGSEDAYAVLVGLDDFLKLWELRHS